VAPRLVSRRGALIWRGMKYEQLRLHLTGFSEEFCAQADTPPGVNRSVKQKEPQRHECHEDHNARGLFSLTCRVEVTVPFDLRSRSDGSTDFAMEERFSGLMLPLASVSLPDLGPIFDRFARDLKTLDKRDGGLMAWPTTLGSRPSSRARSLLC
jgi:hypothetical protein